MAAKAIFLDRDNTIIEDPGYIGKPDQVKLLPDAADALKTLKTMGYKLIVISNQSGIARGMFTENDLAAVHERLNHLLAQHGVALDGIYYCPYHPDGVIEKYCRESDLRKPNPGMILTAAKEHNITLSQSWLIGDAYRDTTAGKRAGCRTILVSVPGHANIPKPNEPSPDFKAGNLREAVNIIKRYGATAPVTEPEVAAPPIPQPKPQPAAKVVVQTSKPDVEPIQPAAPAAVPQMAEGSKIESMFEQLISTLKANRRDEMFTDFSLSRLLAGCLQIVAVFCLLPAVWFLLAPSARSTNGVMISLGFGILFQLMSLTLYIMSKK